MLRNLAGPQGQPSDDRIRRFGLSRSGSGEPDGSASGELIMGGVPCIAGTRIPVATVVGLPGRGYSIDEVLADYPTLSRDDIPAALRFAAQRG